MDKEIVMIRRQNWLRIINECNGRTSGTKKEWCEANGSRYNPTPCLLLLLNLSVKMPLCIRNCHFRCQLLLHHILPLTHR